MFKVFFGLVVTLVVRLVRLAKTGGKTDGKIGPPVDSSPTMQSRMAPKDPKTHFFNAKSLQSPEKTLVLNPNTRRTRFDQKSQRHLEEGVARWHTQTNRQTLLLVD